MNITLNNHKYLYLHNVYQIVTNVIFKQIYNIYNIINTYIYIHKQIYIYTNIHIYICKYNIQL
jgi:hypothetical protein